ncbi:DNA primase [Janthinobacterium sp. CG23_2]|nr:DNA primase [Janthinobacterium sp. CG23_2]CUI03977.1 DNA primase [Janthinobacterium sp. CG23_2]CUI03987.1 DNA primase [Janthinobacterium sp. CG23_2]CUU26631.1 DNA primase [Janthinobacterium sp. CG23_2]CUU27763.1 DNA primase [Janthinobacterium sp. CG23_2]
MARIPDAEIERLKNEVSLVRLIESQGHTLTKRGKDWVMRCVFHEDATASLVVTDSKNLYHCFGCNAAGSVLDWVMKTQGVSLPHAVALLKGGAPLEGERVGVTRSHQRHLPPLVADTADDQALLVQVTDYYHSALKQSPDALAYLQNRGLVSADMIDVFKLGYADRTLTYRLPPGQNLAGREIRARLQALGVYRSSGHEHLNGCIVVPVIGMEDGAVPEQGGQVMQLYGRRIAPNSKISGDQPRHMYLPRPLKGIWNEAALVASHEIILCESLIDALTFWCAGFRNVIAAYGVNGFTVDHWQALKRHSTRRVLIAYDRDDAGNAAADKLAPELLEAGIECFRVLFPKGMDANDYALKVQPAGKGLGLVLQQAEWLGKGKRPGVAVIEQAPGETSAAKEEAPEPQAAPAPALPEPPAPAEPEPMPAPAAVASSLAAFEAPELPPIPATAAAPAEAQPEQKTIKGELLLALGDRHWRIRGWQKNLSPETMRVNVQVRRDASDKAEAAYYVDTLDVYSAKQRMVYIKQAAVELGVQDEAIKRDLGRVLLKLESLQDGAIQEALAPKDAVPQLSDSEQAAALALLKAPDLTRRLVADMERCGVVGEATNLLAGYLAAVSRKLDAPLAVLIQSSSAAGKSSLMDAVLNLVPDEERIQYSAMTGQSLFYLGETDLQHKILAIAEEEGVRQAAYALKLLQSDGELTIASTGKDDTTGNLITKQYRVKGPVMLMLTTTAIDVDEELLNRCLVLTVNESREQTQAIHARQRAKQTLAGLMMDNDKQSIMALHQNAQRLLKPVHVVNPYANRLTFLDDKTRMRRDHMKYLTLIRAIALLHQYQRPVRSVMHRDQRLEYIEVTKDDIALANRIAHEVLGRTLDELPPQPRRLLTMLQAWVAERCAALDMQPAAFRFTRKEVREVTRWGDTQLKLYFARLVELEYLIAHFNGRRQSTDYELLYDGKGDSNPHLMGLIDPATLDNGAEWSDKNSEWSASGRDAVGMQSGCGRIPKAQAVPGVVAELPKAVPKTRSKKNGAPSPATVVEAIEG